MCLGGVDFRCGLRATMIVFIPFSGEECKLPSEWLPRQCPSCLQFAVIGHGRRWRQAHDSTQSRILVRRGICKLCHRTLTVLPSCCVPHAHYSLVARQQAIRLLADGCPVEQASPQCLDSDRLPDSSTIRRWSWLRLASLQACVILRCLFCAPTLLAWDFPAALRILPVEPVPP